MSDSRTANVAGLSMWRTANVAGLTEWQADRMAGCIVHGVALCGIALCMVLQFAVWRGRNVSDRHTGRHPKGARRPPGAGSEVGASAYEAAHLFLREFPIRLFY